MKRRAFFTLTACTGLASNVPGPSESESQPALGRFPISDSKLKDFLADTLEIRKSMREKGADLDLNRSTALALEKKVIAAFSMAAEKGERRYQFYFGRLYEELHWLTEKKEFATVAEKWFSASAAQNHPGATYQLIKKLPNFNDKILTDMYTKAIHLGSVSALALCSGATSVELRGKNWMQEGPMLNRPEDACVKSWSQVFSNWMLIYHFLVIWDKNNKFFRLDLPNTNLLGIMSGQVHPGDDYVEEFGLDVIRKLTKKAAAQASTMGFFHEFRG